MRFEDVDAFRSWERAQAGRWELHAGEAFALAPERVGHTRIKANAWRALDRALRGGTTGCEALACGATVRIGTDRSFSPDALVTCGERVCDDSQEIEAPVLVVEVLSPSTQHVDAGIKLSGYFTLLSVRHYLVVSSTERLVLHHRRGDGRRLLTGLHRSGSIEFEALGATVDVDEFFYGTDIR